LHKISTDDGIRIDVKPLSENADSSMGWRREPDSTVIDESDLHSEKHDLHKFQRMME
jgi:hypothetical protein